ncbi:MAG: 30S ribosomal protein S7, partial [Anaerolinea sp.]|nr:30S ribosomal protein S7 [Anaerolinea sp.]
MRRTKPEPREISADVRYNSVPVTFFIHRIMKRGKKSVATRIMYEVMDIIKEKTNKNPIEVLDQALKNVGPQMEVRPRRVG